MNKTPSARFHTSVIVSDDEVRSPDSKRQRCRDDSDLDDVIVLSDSEDSIVISDSDDSVVVVKDLKADPTDQVSSSTSKLQSSRQLDTTEVDGFIQGVPEYYSNNPSMPIFERIPPSRKRLYSIEDLVRLLLHPPLRVSRFISTCVPTSVCESVTFVVDVDRLENQDDVLADDMGVWKNNGVDTNYVHATLSERKVTSVEKCGPPSTSANTYKVKRVYRTHATDGTLKKLTAYIYDPSGKLVPLVLIVYKFDGIAEHAVLTRPHGNAKTNKPYRRTRESTKNMLKLELEHSRPKEAVDAVFTKRGGIVSSQSAGELPRGRSQAYNLKKKLQQEQLVASIGAKVPTSSGYGMRDMLYVVMEQCKNAEKTDIFVQDVMCAPEPMAVLCNEQQLSDLARFCCDPFNFSILGIDPTFNLGEFSVTPTVYRHLLLCDRRTGRSPLLLGPMLVHYHKHFRSYNYFLSTLVGLKREIEHVNAVGTDGEKNLVDAVIRNFPHVSHVRCFRHLQQNIEMHLRDEQFPPGVVKEYTRDIFGWSETDGSYHEGLVDCLDIESFNTSLEALKPKWDRQEQNAFQDQKSHEINFHTWFTKFKADDFRYCMLRSLKEDIGLGSPPLAYYTNDSESINALLKESLGYKKHQWGVFNDKVKRIVKQQQREMERAIIGYGEYMLRPQYSFLAISEEKWFKMLQDQRLKSIQKFNACAVRPSNREGASMSTSLDSQFATLSSIPTASDPSKNMQKEDSSSNYHEEDGSVPDITVGHFSIHDGQFLSVPLEEGIANTYLPQATAEGIWKKAAMLVREEKSIVPAPGFGPNDKMVKSKSGATPHLVTITKHNKMVQYKCDDKCPQYKSVYICSHTVAAAELNGDLADFLKWFRQNPGKKVPNLSELGAYGMPAGAGRKGGKVARKKTTRTKLNPTDENRVPLDTTPHPSTGSSRQVLSPVEYNIHVSASGMSSVSTHNTYSPATNWQGYCSPSTGATYPCYSNWHTYSNLSPPANTAYPSYHGLHPYAWPSPSYPLWTPPSTSPPQFSSPPLPPPPPPHPPPISGSDGSEWLSSDPYKVCFKVGNISVCNGCRNNFSKSDKIVIQHAEFLQFTSPRTGLPASKFGNTYYHASRRCIELRWGASFNSCDIIVPDSVKQKLTPLQKDTLSTEFMITL